MKFQKGHPIILEYLNEVKLKLAAHEPYEPFTTILYRIASKFTAAGEWVPLPSSDLRLLTSPANPDLKRPFTPVTLHGEDVFPVLNPLDGSAGTPITVSGLLHAAVTYVPTAIAEYVGLLLTAGTHSRRKQAVPDDRLDHLYNFCILCSEP